MSYRLAQTGRMKLVDHRYNEARNHLALTLKFGDAVIFTDAKGRQLVEGGSESDRNAARIWLKYFVADSLKRRTPG